MGNPRAILLSMGNSPCADAQERVRFGGGVETLNTPAPLKDEISLEAGEGTTKYSYACFLVQVYIGMAYVCVWCVVRGIHTVTGIITVRGIFRMKPVLHFSL